MNPLTSRDPASYRAHAGIGDAPARGPWTEAHNRIAERFLAIPRPAKRLIAVLLDAAICFFVTVLAFYLRLGEWVPITGNRWISVIASIVLAIPLFIVSGLYRAIFRYADTAAIVAIAKAILVYGVIYAGLITFIQFNSVPRTIGIIQPILLFIFIASSRVLVSWLLGGSYLRLLKDENRQTVLIYGAGSAGRQLLKSLQVSEIRVAAFIDDDERMQGRVMLGCPVYGPAEIAKLAQRYKLTDVLLAIPSATRRRRHEIVEMIRPMAIAVRTIPGMIDVAKGRIKIDELRDLEIEDLLGRDAVAPDSALMGRNITGKVVLVTGAGGSIGSELCRQIVARGPARLLLVEMSEPSLYFIHRELGELIVAGELSVELIPLLGSACDRSRITDILATWRPDTIYHAAAYKHVPLVEHNPNEGIRNNVFGTLTVAQAARDAEVRDFVLISTDKAVRPTNIMGASKRLAEQALQALAAGSTGTRFSMVRFGNVLGSSGSVVPLFRQQIRSGGPITITHPDITRYFMTIPEAAELVIQAGAMAAGGEVFVLDMGEPIRIVDLARMMVELSGLALRDADNPEGEIEIAFVGLRPGEKLYEELLIGNSPAGTDHPRIMKAAETFLPWSELGPQLARVEAALATGQAAPVVELLHALVPEYTPESGLSDWIHRARGAAV